MTIRLRVALLALVAFFPLLVACGGGGGLELQPVTGTVTLDGKPIEDGRIKFVAFDGNQPSFSGKIANGVYAVETSAGSMRVDVRASRLIPGKFDECSNPGEKSPVGEMYIPERYNSRSELTANIPAGGGVVDFDLTGG